MKQHYNFSYFLNEKHLVILITVIFFIGLGIKASAQSIMIENDYAKMNNSIKVKLNNDKVLMIPEYSNAEMLSVVDAEEHMIVFQSDKNTGYYAYDGQHWIKRTIRDILVETHNNTQFLLPDADAIVLIAGGDQTVQLIDYNKHIAEINSMLYADPESAFAANQLKKSDE